MSFLKGRNNVKLAICSSRVHLDLVRTRVVKSDPRALLYPLVITMITKTQSPNITFTTADIRIFVGVTGTPLWHCSTQMPNIQINDLRNTHALEFLQELSEFSSDIIPDTKTLANIDVPRRRYHVELSIGFVSVAKSELSATTESEVIKLKPGFRPVMKHSTVLFTNFK
ncbi:unnamed protein product, partial [Allacma fusca]